MNLELTDEQRELRDFARHLADSELRSRAAYWDEQEEFPERSLELYREHGLLGLTMPTELGGRGLGVFEGCLVLEQLATACMASAMALQMCVNGPPRALLALGTEEQRARHVPRVIAGEAWFAIAMTEPQAGSDALALRTELRSTPDGLRLHGEKCFITGGDRATDALVFCRAPGTSGADGIGAVLVSASAEGYSVPEIIPKHGGRGVREAMLRFDGVPIAEEDVVLWPKEGSRAGARTLVTQFNPERCGNAAMALGTAVGAYELALEHARTREQFGQPIADFQGIRWKFADMLMDIDAARLLLWRAASTDVDGFPSGPETIMAKLYASEMAQRVTNQALQIHGHLGYARGTPVERYYRNARGFALGGGTSEVARNIIGGEIVRGPRPRAAG
jgi:alkylation response protein AidB-like acyl-CoA dehydrogenase